MYDVNDSFTGTDLDRDGQAITYSFTAGNGLGGFAIDASTGAITVANSAVMDFETHPTFTLTVSATDGSVADTASITINLQDVGEGAPLPSDPNPDPNDFDGLVGTATTGYTLVEGDDGDNNLPGGGGTDQSIFNGFGGADTINTQGGNDIAYGGGGNDVINGQNGADLLYGQAGDDKISGDQDIDTIYGGSGNDLISGGDAADVIYGGSGADVISGNDNNDLIIGGYGADTLTGDNGSDTFRYLYRADTGDTITDFNSISDPNAGGSGGGDIDDKIDLSALDANVATGTNDAFTFVIAQTTSVQANRVTWYQDAVNNQTIIQADVNGDTTADLTIKLTGIHTLQAGDFTL